MFRNRLLVALCLCSLPAFAQEHLLITENAGSNLQQAPNFRTPPAATPSEPWRILPKPNSSKDKVLMLITPEMGPEGITVSQGGPLEAEPTCYAIRSYVVARDKKDSDSVHPVGSSTCISTSRYRLKPADDDVAR